MRYELSDSEWSIISGMLPNKSRGVARVDDRRVLNGIFWVHSGGSTSHFSGASAWGRCRRSRRVLRSERMVESALT